VGRPFTGEIKTLPTKPGFSPGPLFLRHSPESTEYSYPSAIAPNKISIYRRSGTSTPSPRRPSVTRRSQKTAPAPKKLREGRSQSDAETSAKEVSHRAKSFLAYLQQNKQTAHQRSVTLFQTESVVTARKAPSKTARRIPARRKTNPPARAHLARAPAHHRNPPQFRKSHMSVSPPRS
jgi:hypothetical protein